MILNLNGDRILSDSPAVAVVMTQIFLPTGEANVRAYYQQFEEQQTQSLSDEKVKEHLGQTAAGGGTAFQQHLAAVQAGQYKPPIVGSAPGVPPSSQSPLLSSIWLPVLPLLTPPTSGYNSVPGGQYQYRPNPAGNSQPNGLSTPPTLTPPGASTPPTGPPSNPPSFGSYNYGPNAPAISRPGAPSNSSYLGQKPPPGPQVHRVRILMAHPRANDAMIRITLDSLSATIEALSLTGCSCKDGLFSRRMLVRLVFMVQSMLSLGW
ncbi:unnamed protein product [Calypogeia fissa]